MRQLERQEEYEERFALVSERVDQLKEDAEVPDLILKKWQHFLGW